MTLDDEVYHQPEDFYQALAERLTERREDIQCELFSRIREISDELQADAQYLDGLRTTVAAMLDYIIKAIGTAGEQPLEIPSHVTEQARLAARNGISVETVMRRYVIGSHLLQSFVTDEAKPYSSHVLRKIIHLLGFNLERVVAVAADAHKQEKDRLARSADQLQAERIERLLVGQSIPESEDIRYKTEDLWHISVIAVGPARQEAVAMLAGELGCEMLPLERGKETIWGWLGSRERIGRRKFEAATSKLRTPGTKVAVGECQFGLRGWRESHRQAQSALAVAQRRDQPVTCWLDVSLEALVLQDEIVARQMISLYLGPLTKNDPKTQDQRKTMRVYLGSGQVIKTAAMRLNVSRRTVEDRKNAAQELLDYDITARHAEFDIALRVFELLEGHE